MAVVDRVDGMAVVDRVDGMAVVDRVDGMAVVASRVMAHLSWDKPRNTLLVAILKETKLLLGSNTQPDNRVCRGVERCTTSARGSSH